MPTATAAPTTLAIAELDDAGVAEYTFYLDGTSAGELGPDAVAAGTLDDSRAIVFGGLGIVMEPIASTLRELVADIPETTMVFLDVNCRPGAIKDLDAYRQSVAELLPYVDIVKVSSDDMRLLAPGDDPGGASRVMLERGPGTVLLTDGPAPVRIYTTSRERSVPVPDVRVVDTIGAGDAFVAAFVMAWSAGNRERGRLAPDELARATMAATRVATAACSVAGANLPEDLMWPGTEESPASMTLS